MTSNSDSMSDVLLHSDALHCLKRKQLENLCTRLSLKATGKKDELIARLEGYASAKAALEGSSSIGTIVPARSSSRTRSTTESLTSLSTSEAIPEEVVDSDMNGTPDAGSSIRLITNPDESGVEHKGDISTRSSRTIVKETPAASKNVEAQVEIPSSSSSRSIYPWKRIASSSSLSKRLRSASSRSIASSEANPTPSDEPMAMDEFGAEKAPSRVNSIGSQRWLSNTSSSSSLAKQKEAVESPETTTAAQAPAQSSSPMAKRKRNSDEIVEEIPLSPEVEVPVKRAIKPRPSRAVKSSLASPSRQTPTKICSPTTVSQADFSQAAAKVLEEMNARLVQNGKPSMVQLPAPGSRSVSSNMKPPASPLKSINSRTKGRFSGEHAKNFGQMESIASHYAAKRIELASREWNGAASASASAKSTKRIKIDETQKEKRTEERAVLQRKLDLAKQRRKSGGRRVSMGRKSAGVSPRVGFRSKITGAVRDFVGAASKMASSVPVATAPEKIVTPRPAAKPLPPTPNLASNSGSLRQPKSKPTFDLQASLARRPVGYKPYSAKETVQLLQTAAAVPKSPTKPTEPAPTPYSPIRNGWTMVAPPKRVASSSSTIAFPCVSPEKEKEEVKGTVLNTSTPHHALKSSSPSFIEVATKSAPRRNTMQNTGSSSKKTRSSISTARQGTLQADRLKRISKLNETKHQASMAARQRQTVAVQRAIDDKVAAAAAAKAGPSGTGRGTPRKASAKMQMQGKGRGVAGLKRVVS